MHTFCKAACLLDRSLVEIRMVSQSIDHGSRSLGLLHTSIRNYPSPISCSSARPSGSSALALRQLLRQGVSIRLLTRLSHLSHDIAPINRQIHTSKPAHIVAGQHHGEFGNVLRRAHTPERMSIGEYLWRRPTSCRVLKHSRVCEPRADGVAVDAILRIFQGHLSGEA